MAGVTTRRCPSCHELVLAVDRGRVKLVGETRFVEARPSGDLVFRCDDCSELVVWNLGSPRVEGVTVTLAPPPMHDVIQVMEERWEAFRLTKLRKRGTIAVGLRFDVFTRDGFRCRYCGVSVDDGAILHADHVIPESKGGPTTLENLVTACMDCNLGKSNKDLPT